MKKILLLSKNREDYYRLQEVLASESYIVTLGKELNLNSSFELLIVDQFNLLKFANNIRALRKQKRAGAVPVLLISSCENNDLCEVYDLVDEVLNRPIEELEFKLRLNSLLKLRQLTLLTMEKQKYFNLHDQVTGLYNRTYFNQKLKRLDADSDMLPISIVMVDINGLKHINDLLNYEQGDKLLKQVAKILKNLCSEQDIIARWGGDEFVILLPSSKPQKAIKFCQLIKEDFNQLEVEGINIDIALGRASKTGIEESLTEVLKEAEHNMYRNKLTENNSIRNSIIASLERALQEKTHETREHARRMTSMALKMGNRLSLPNNQLNELSLLARLHDIGKVAIPESILNKQGELTAEEWEVIKTHPESGYRIAESIPELSQVAECILYHHERWDAQGYPAGLKAEKIPFNSRIIAIVDAYDVMTHSRAYKQAFSQAEALDELENCAGSQFDPYLVRVFKEIFIN